MLLDDIFGMQSCVENKSIETYKNEWIIMPIATTPNETKYKVGTYNPKSKCTLEKTEVFLW